MSQNTDPKGESFLQRWSRRKQQVQRSNTQPSPKLTDEAETEVANETALATRTTTLPTAAVTSDADMPAVDTLTEHSDLSQFFSKGVSDQLRRQALRAVFRQAKFNVCDGLDVYAGDFTKFEPLGDVITYEMRQTLVREAEKAAKTLGNAQSATNRDEHTQITTHSAEEPTTITDVQPPVQNSPA